MSFVKLDTGILDSTLWVSRDPREIFITALLMALPQEFEEPLETYKVHSLDKTPFIVPPGWYGFIGASGPGIVRRAGLPPDAGLEALAVLGEPDPESRSSDWEGRRLVRVDGGFIVLNFMKYRDKDNTAAARQARYRERLKTRNVAPDTRNGDAETRNCRLAEAEAEADIRNTEDKKKAPAVQKPADVDAQAWADWLAVRKAKRAGPVTGTAIAALQREATKAGISLQAAVRTCAERGWQGFRADWYANTNGGAPRNGTGQHASEPAWRTEQRNRVAEAAPYAVRKQPREHFNPEKDYPDDLLRLPPAA